MLILRFGCATLTYKQSICNDVGYIPYCWIYIYAKYPFADIADLADIAEIKKESYLLSLCYFLLLVL